TGVITNAYRPGIIRMGSNWDPFGENQADLTQDWWRALTHELGHYLLFMPDNYLGLDPASGQLITTDCVGSFMTNSNDDAYSEFLPANDWTGPCLTTIAAQTTGRPDWDTIIHFYPWLNQPTNVNDNPGPGLQPLALPTVNTITATATTLPVRNFMLRDATTNQVVVRPQGRGYLLQTNNTPADLTDDSLIPLGLTNAGGDRIKVRGAQPGDQLCLIDTSTPTAYLGCEDVTPTSASVPVSTVNGWQPAITVQSPTSETLAITVTQYISSANLNVQVIPAYGLPGSDNQITTTVGAFTVVDPANPVTFTTLLNLDYLTFEGHVRIWVPDSTPLRQAISRYTISLDAWGGESAIWGGESAVWSGESAIWSGESAIWGGESAIWGGPSRAWGAPSVSPDGQLIIINTDDPFGPTGTGTLQAIDTLPNLPAWFTLVGQAYRVQLQPGFTAPITRTIAFDYLQRQTPPGYETTLNIYVSYDDGQTWTPIPTTRDTDDNRAIALMDTNTPEGIYALIATLPLVQLNPGWNQFGYPFLTPRSVTATLASIEKEYTAIYHQTNTGNWRLHDPAVPTTHPNYTPLINDLHTLTLGQPYHIHITGTSPITLFVGVPSNNQTTNLQTTTLAPAIYYGPIIPTATFTPTVGMPITMSINGNICGTGTVTNTVPMIPLAYKIQALADNGNGCGNVGETAVFQVGPFLMSDTASWDNRQANYHPLSTTSPPCTTPAINTITLTPLNPYLLVNWSTATTDNYTIYRALNQPYFTPTTPHLTTTNTSFFDQFVLGDPQNNYFYSLQTQNECGPSPLYRFGEFDFPLIPGT
ncbi:MAG TPA: hypothetical protein VLL52_07780, partial [Anaerolineae bacterium]|nr:hypothetical protein [Anaerolineae bacterium]